MIRLSRTRGWRSAVAFADTIQTYAKTSDVKARLILGVGWGRRNYSLVIFRQRRGEDA